MRKSGNYSVLPLLIYITVILPGLYSPLYDFLLYQILLILVILNMPIIYLSRKLASDLQFSALEFISINMVLNAAFTMFSYVFLCIFIDKVNGVHVLLFQFFIMVVQLVYCRDLNLVGLKSSTCRVDWISGFSSFLLVFVGMYVRLPGEYWRGSDVWVYHAVISKLIDNSLGPVQLVEYFRGSVDVWVSGYFYFLSAISVVSHLSPFTLLRFLGPVFSGFFSLLSFSLIRRVSNSETAFLTSILLLFQPFLMSRFISPLRENFSFILLLGFLSVFESRKVFEGRKASTGYLVSLGAIMSSVFITHSLTTMILLGILFFSDFKRLLSDTRILISEYTVTALTGFTLSMPYLSLLSVPIMGYLQRRISPYYLFLPVLFVIFLWLYYRYSDSIIFKRYKKGYISSLFLILSFILPFIYHRNYDPILKFKYLTLDMFDLPILIVSFLGFLLLEDNKVRVVELFAFVLSIIFNVTLFGAVIPHKRLVVYISWVFSFTSALFLMKILELVSHRVSVNFLIKPRLYYALVILLGLSSFTNQSIGVFESVFTSYEVEDARMFGVRISDDVGILAEDGVFRLLLFAGVEPVQFILDDGVIQEIKNSDSVEEISEILSAHYNISYLYLYSLKSATWYDPEYMPSLNLINEEFTVSEYRSTTVYSLHLKGE